MKTEMPLSKPIRRFLNQTEEMLDTEISLLRQPDAEPGGTLVDVYTYEMEKNVNVIIFPAQYVGLLKDFIIAKHCTNLLIKGAAHKKAKYQVFSYTEDSVYRGMRQIYFDALKDEAKEDRTSCRSRSSSRCCSSSSPTSTTTSTSSRGMR